MVKDSKNSHPGNRLWGEGWGWSWFDAANPVKTTSKDFRTDCRVATSQQRQRIGSMSPAIPD